MPWAMVDSWTYSTNVAQVQFVGLGAYTDVRVVLRNVTLSGSGLRSLQVSTDNGSTFLNTASDYFSVSGAGAETGITSIGFHATAASAARSGEIEINGFDLGTPPKTAQRNNQTAVHTVIIPTTSALNAVRVFDSSGNNLTGGSIYVYAQ
jgi:hypothetical protein